jgi:hypothetical protein
MDVFLLLSHRVARVYLPDSCLAMDIHVTIFISSALRRYTGGVEAEIRAFFISMLYGDEGYKFAAPLFCSRKLVPSSHFGNCLRVYLNCDIKLKF